MSYGASSNALSDRKKYPLFYRTYPTDDKFNPARIALLKHFNWSRVATIHENHELFSLVGNDWDNQEIQKKIKQEKKEYWGLE